MKQGVEEYEYTGPTGGEFDGGPSVLLHFDATPGSTNVVDSNGIASNIIMELNAQISYPNSKFGTSLSFTKTGGILTFNTPGYNWKQGNQCQVEMWCYTTNGTYPVIMFINTAVGSTPPYYLHFYGDSMIFADKFGAILMSVPATKFPLNQYYHLALSNDGVNIRMFVDGVMVGKSATPSVDYGPLDQVRLGYRWENIIVYTVGNYDEFKFRYNTSVYNSDVGFTPQPYPFNN